MPTYEYRCGDCGAEFEVFQKIGADAPPCETCESDNVTRLISGGSFVLKGGGWYKDGYSGASNSGGSSASSGSSSSGSSSSSSSSSSTSSSESSSSGKASD